MSASTVGFVGLGNMGSVLASNLAQHGQNVVAFDAAGPARTPRGATAAADIDEVARRADVVVFSLPDGYASEQVARQIVAVDDRRVTHIVDASTLGVPAARAIDALLTSEGVGYVDSPVSGGVAGARARTLMVMFAGADGACKAVEPVLAGLSDRRHRVGNRPGMAQALKLANNFLAATTMVATSEAVAFCASVGLDMITVLEVLNASSGQSAATSDKFPKHVLTGRFSAGFANTLMHKDVQLYLQAVEEQGGSHVLAGVSAAVWERFATDEPGVDFTRIYPFVEQSY